MSMTSEPETRPRGSFTDRVAVVIGGGSGLGRAVAKTLARQGARVVVADFDAPRMERTVEEVLRLGTADAAIALSADVSSDASVRSLARDAIKAMGRVDIVVNAAGVLLQGKLERITGDDWTWMLETNLVGAVRTSTAFLPHMLSRGSGHIVNVVSHGGLVPRDDSSLPYDTGHAAVAVFSEGLARRLKGTGVVASIFCPGSTGPRIGQNTRSRGIGRIFRGADTGPDASSQLDQLAGALVDGLHHRTFLILGDQSEADVFRGRWDQVDANSSSL